MPRLKLPRFRFSLALVLWGMVLLSLVLALSQQSGKQGVVVASFGAGAVVGILMAGPRGSLTLALGALGGALGGGLGPIFVWLFERAQAPWQALICAVLGAAIQGAFGGLLVGAIHWLCCGIVENVRERLGARRQGPPPLPPGP
jgi:hypothetical protein